MEKRKPGTRVIYDLIVIGAGPAGCATAISAARAGARVLLLERGHFPRHKVCGEFVSAESLGLLDTLLTADHRSLIAGAPRISISRIFADGAEIPAEINPPAASIARYDLDNALWASAIQSGVESLEGCAVKSVERGSSQFFRVATQSGAFEARALVNATGRWSFLTAASTRTRASSNRWIGIKAHFREEAAAASVDLYFFPGGYCGVQPVTAPEGGSKSLINACAMVKANIATELDQVFQLHPALRSRSMCWQAAMSAVTTSPLIFHEPEPVQGDILQAGDSATFVDPFIGDGISLALRSGTLAAECLGPLFSGECILATAAAEYSRRYHRQLAPVFRASSHLRNFLRLPGLVRRPVMSILQRTPAITRHLVRMTR
ncbi:MAG TPA: NAD(P)/FAD-dependent oxidoreductase [Terriglobales bacterium]